jgi:type IV pilus assembly protein PilB
MEIDPYLIADTVKGIIAQRLLRRICSNCKAEMTMTDEDRKKFEPYGIIKVYHGQGCAQCDGKGYKGRFGIYEWLPLALNIRDGIRKRLSLDKLYALAVQNGLVPLKEVAAKSVRDGVTTISEFDKI